MISLFTSFSAFTCCRIKSWSLSRKSMNLTTFAKITGDNSDNSVISPPSLFLQLSKTSQKRPEMKFKFNSYAIGVRYCSCWRMNSLSYQSAYSSYRELFLELAHLLWVKIFHAFEWIFEAVYWLLRTPGNFHPAKNGRSCSTHCRLNRI